MDKCLCGCGREVKKIGNRYISGHNTRGKKCWWGYKVSLANKGRILSTIPSFKGKHHSQETKLHLSTINKGQPPWNKGITGYTRRNFGDKVSYIELNHLYAEMGLSSFEIAEMYSVSSQTILRWLEHYKIPIRKLKDSLAIRWKNKIHGLKGYVQSISHVQKRFTNRRPTKPEQRVIEIIAKYNLPYIYTGNGSFWIDRYNPDFVNNNGSKIALEVFGEYWHDPMYGKANYKATEKGRREILKKYGWNVVILWDRDIFNKLDEEIVEIINNGGVENEPILMYKMQKNI